MKRRMNGKIKVIGYYPVTAMTALYLLPFEASDYWEAKKGNDSIALFWNGKVHYRTLYYRTKGVCFKFFNKWLYLYEIIRTEGRLDYIYV